jgi:hypothetical protein
VRVSYGADAGAVASAGPGGSGGAGAAVAIVLTALVLLTPTLTRGLRLAADGPPAEPVLLVRERPG